MSQPQIDEYAHLPPTFNEIVDFYNETIQKANQLRKTKNEEYKVASPESKPLIDEKFKPQLEALNLQLKEKNTEFSNLMTKYLTEYKENPKNENTLVFPPKLIGEFRKMIHDMADKLGFLHESLGSGANRKLTVSKEFKEPLLRKKVKTDPKQKNLTKLVKKLEFPPDEITCISVVSIDQEKVKIKIEGPECYDNPIKGYHLYCEDCQEVEASKVIIKVENSEEMVISLKENEALKTKKDSLCSLKFKLTAINDYGESFLSSTFQIMLTAPRKGRAFCAGSCKKNKIPIETLSLPPDTISQTNFIEIPLAHNATNQIKSYDTSLLLLDSHVLVQWGVSLIEDPNEKSEDSVNEVYSEPFVPSLSLIVHKISVGKDFCCLISCLGEVFTWGYNDCGQLGQDDRLLRISPTPIKSLKNTIFIDISCGNQHCLALDVEGKVYSWGRNQAIIGQTEILDRYGKISNYQNIGVHQFKPRLMKEVLGYYKIKWIHAGGYHNAVVTEGEELYVWGDNESSQLGLKELEAVNITIPKQIEIFTEKKCKILDVSCGGLHTLALVLEVSGTIDLWSWGDETQGQCGSGVKKNTHYPEIIKFFEAKKIEKISAGTFHSMVLVEGEGIYGFGFNGNGEFGMKTEKKKIRAPVKIEGVPEGKILDIQAGFEISWLILS